MYMIGVDIGTTSTKAVLYDRSGHIKASHHVLYPLYTDVPDAAEQDPAEIFDAVLMTIKHVVREAGAAKNEIDFVSFSSAMHSLILMDDHNQPLTRSITWADNRSHAHAKWLKHNHPDIYERTGTPIHPMSPLSKMLWLKEEESALYRQTKKFIGIKEYVFYELFNRYVVDYSIASATGLFNIHELAFDRQVLELLAVDRSQLSEPVDTTTYYTDMNTRYADLMGISTDTPFVIGASDGVLSNLGVNAFKPGEVAVTIGTSGAIRTVIDQPKTDQHGRLFCYALTKDQWVIGGPVNNGGIVLRWIRDELAASETETAKRLGVESYDVLMKIAERVPAGSNGLLFHPYLAGERAPLWNADVRGSFFGLTLRHQKEHMIRAALEGVIFNLYSVFIALTVLMDEPVKSLKATGGFAKSELWRQMMADIFDHELIVPESHESSCLGAMALGQVALHQKENFDHIDDMVGSSYQHSPNFEHVKVYRELLPIYLNLTQSLAENYTAIADFQRTQGGENK